MFLFFHSCAGRNPESPNWIPAFAGMTAVDHPIGKPEIARSITNPEKWNPSVGILLNENAW